ncbi:MAG: RidA family protein [Aestuariivirga sp.]|nr:RidA family protein [Aestuariivirga sp.]
MNFTDTVRERLAQRGLALPLDLPRPAGAYEPYRLWRGTGYLAAQIPGYGPDSFPGRLGAELSLKEGQQAAARAALNAIARIHQALSGFDRFEGLLHVAGHVASVEDFLDQPEVLDGASELFAFVLGEKGLHSRTAYAAPRLPKNVSIELEVTFAYLDNS